VQGRSKEHDEKTEKKAVPRDINVALLGAAIKLGLLPFTTAEIGEVIKTRLPKKLVAMNLAAFKTGQEKCSLVRS
jgi:Pyruvate/2-oxoacid:ferredoxin oxidoreductase gamma subunit